MWWQGTAGRGGKKAGGPPSPSSVGSGASCPSAGSGAGTRIRGPHSRPAAAGCQQRAPRPQARRGGAGRGGGTTPPGPPLREQHGPPAGSRVPRVPRGPPPSGLTAGPAGCPLPHSCKAQLGTPSLLLALCTRTGMLQKSKKKNPYFSQTEPSFPRGSVTPCEDQCGESSSARLCDCRAGCVGRRCIKTILVAVKYRNTQ